MFFAPGEEMHNGLEMHHATAAEFWVRIHTKGSGKTSVTPREAQDQAMCFGWVDSMNRRIDDESYMLRFTPRRPRSNWTPQHRPRRGASRPGTHARGRHSRL